MPSKPKGKSKPASEKRAARLPRIWDKTKRFQKDWDRYAETGRFDMRHLKAAMVALIINDEQLPAERRDHDLSGRWAGYRECHIHGDFLLVYELKDDGDTVVFCAIGTHSELFG